jgi:hypothetical protein
VAGAISVFIVCSFQCAFSSDFIRLNDIRYNDY